MNFINLTLLVINLISGFYVLLYPKVYTYIRWDDLDYILFFVIILLVLIYLKRQQLKNRALIPDLLPGSLILAASFVLNLFLTTTNQPLLTLLPILLYLTGITLFIAGRQIWLQLILPYSLLIVTFFFLQWSLNLISLFLQKITAVEAFLMLKLIGLAEALNGLVIVLPTIDIVIDHTCNGVNNITALVVLAMLLWYSGQKSGRTRIWLILIAAALGLLLNGMRVALIGIWAELFPAADPHGPGSIFYEKFIFVLGSILLLFIADKLNSKNSPKSKIQNLKSSPNKPPRLTPLQANLIVFGFNFFVFMIKLVVWN